MVEDITVEFFATFFIYFLFAGLIALWFIDGKIKKEQVIDEAEYGSGKNSEINEIPNRHWPLFGTDDQ